MIIPAFGKPEQLRQALLSVAEQTLPPAEVVVVDDGSPEPMNAALGAEFPLVRFVRKAHSGIAATRNYGLAQATGNYILWLDSDDALLPQAVESLVETVERMPEVDVVYGDLIVTDPKLKPIRLHRHQDWFGRNRELAAEMVFGNPIPNPGTLVRRRVFERWGGYDETFERSEDYQFWSRIVEQACFKHCGRLTLKWRWADRSPDGLRPEEQRCDLRVVKGLLERLPLEEFFPVLSKPQIAPEVKIMIYLRLTERFLHLGSPSDAHYYASLARRSFPSAELDGLVESLQGVPGSVASIGVAKRPRPVKIGNPAFRILMIVQSFPPHSLAGTELYTLRLSEELSRRGHQVDVLHTYVDPGNRDGAITETAYNGLRVFQVNLKAAQPMLVSHHHEPVAESVYRWLAGRSYDLVHFQHVLGVSATTLLKVKRMGLPVVLTLHDTYFICEQPHLVNADENYCSEGPESVDKCATCALRRYRMPPSARAAVTSLLVDRREHLRAALQAADVVVVPTQFLRNALEKHGFLHPHLVVQPLGLEEMPKRPRVPADAEFRMVFLGNLAPVKGLDLLMKALRELEPADWKLSIYGRIHRREYLAECLSLASGSGKVKYVGAYTPDDLPDIFAAADLCVVPSRAENFPTVVRESLYFGVPVVAPRLGGIPEIIPEGAGGLMFRPGDIYDLAEKLRLMKSYPEIYAQCRQSIPKMRTLKEDTAEIEQIYRSLVEKQAPASVATG